MSVTRSHPTLSGDELRRARARYAALGRAIGAVCAAGWASCTAKGPANRPREPWYCGRHAPDPVAIDRVVFGDPPAHPLTPPELVEAIRRLARMGFTGSQIAARCGITPRSVDRLRATHGIPLLPFHSQGAAS